MSDYLSPILHRETNKIRYSKGYIKAREWSEFYSEDRVRVEKLFYTDVYHHYITEVDKNITAEDSSLESVKYHINKIPNLKEILFKIQLARKEGLFYIKVKELYELNNNVGMYLSRLGYTIDGKIISW